MKRYGFTLVDKIREAISVPMTVLGVDGSLKDVGKLVNRYGIVGTATGIFFAFKGIYWVVLIIIPDGSKKTHYVATGVRNETNNSKS